MAAEEVATSGLYKGMSSDNIKGLVLALSSSFFIGGSFIVKKKGLKKAGASGVRAGAGGYSYLYEPLWWTGMIAMIVGEIANFAAYAFAPAILVTPLGALSIIISAVLAHIILRERLHIFGILGCALCVVGSTTIVLHAPQEREIESVKEVWDLATEPAFVCYAILVIAIVLILIFHYVPQYGQTHIWFYIGVCSLVGSLSVMSVKALGIALKLTLSGMNQLIYPQTWTFALVVLVCVLTQMNYLNKGTRIHATITRQHIEKFQSILREGHLYAIKNFIVADNNMKYKTTTSKYKLIFFVKTQVIEYSDESFPVMIFDFKPFEMLSNVDGVDDTILIDVIGKLAAKNIPQDRDIGGRQTKLLDIILEDTQGIPLSCTLWGEYVDQLMNYLENANDETIIIIILQMCRAKKFRGEIHVSNTYNVTKMIINSDSDEINEFRHKLLSSGNTSTPISNISFATTITINEELQLAKDKLRTIGQILESQEAGSFWVYSKIVAIETGADWWYVSCTKCPRKVIPAAGDLYCENCDHSDPNGKIRYKIKVRVVDNTGNVVFVLWDRECSELIGRTAFDLRSICGEKEIPNEVDRMLETQALFKVQIKSSHIGTNNCIYLVMKLIVDNTIISNYREKNFEPQESDVFSKLKESETGNNNEVCSSEDEVTTPLKNTKNRTISEDIVQESGLKRSLMDEFSSTAVGKNLKTVVKIEKG